MIRKFTFEHYRFSLHIFNFSLKLADHWGQLMANQIHLMNKFKIFLIIPLFQIKNLDVEFI